MRRSWRFWSVSQPGLFPGIIGVFCMAQTEAEQRVQRTLMLFCSESPPLRTTASPAISTAGKRLNPPPPRARLGVRLPAPKVHINKNKAAGRGEMKRDIRGAKRYNDGGSVRGRSGRRARMKNVAQRGGRERLAGNG